jgi:hypothetical protein
MRSTLLPLIVCLTLACGEKAPPAPAAEAGPTPEELAAAEAAAEAAQAAALEAARAEAEAALPPPPPPANVDFSATVTRADGTVFSGKVRRLERSEDWYGETGWLDSGYKMKLNLVSGSTAKDVGWSEVKRISVTPGSLRDVDCLYDSDFTPWMYDCTLKTVGKVTLKDGSNWEIDQRHKWRMSFQDGGEVEFWLKKHPARQQDDQVVGLDTVDPQNHDLYVALQDRLRTEMGTILVVRVDLH